jgi:hypothetical protein
VSKLNSDLLSDAHRPLVPNERAHGWQVRSASVTQMEVYQQGLLFPMYGATQYGYIMDEKNLEVITLARGNRNNANRQGNMGMQREQMYMEDIMGAMQLTSKKYQSYAENCVDEEIRRLCQHIAKHQQDDIQAIQQLLGQSGQLQ